MPALTDLRTTTVAVNAGIPSGTKAFFTWLAKRNKNKRKGSASAELAYAEGLAIVKQFLNYAASHTVSELQHFTANKVPSPSYVLVQTAEIPDQQIDQAADYVRKLIARDEKTSRLVGGSSWWTMRGRPLTAEYIEMKRDRLKRGLNPPERILFYLHGGAHFFSSLETHRYQIQRHARKLGAIALAPSYRLAPQYPFPCALHDCLATYLFLLASQPEINPETDIIFSGDSSGAGLALVMMTALRDLGLPLPAAASLISPWVDLAHSFPSISGPDATDYIPSNGFVFKHHLAWPPLPTNAEEQILIGEDLPVSLNEQFQMYCPNSMLDNPLVSPVNQSTLAGLPPLFFIAGGGELLRDEIIYIAHKAAHPQNYLPSERVLNDYPSQRENLTKEFAPTLVHLQVYDDACHVATTLSITQTAKFMYRAAANFGIWATTAARTHKERRQETENSDELKAGNSSGTHVTTGDYKPACNGDSVQQNEDSLPVTEDEKDFPAVSSQSRVNSSDASLANKISHSLASDSETSSSDSEAEEKHSTAANEVGQSIKVNGRVPKFHHHMIRQRVNTKGEIRAMEPETELIACNVKREHVGALHAKPVRKWLAKREAADKKFAKDFAHFRQLRFEDEQKAQSSGYLLGQFSGETPPKASLAYWSDSDLAHEAAQAVDAPGGVNIAIRLWSKLSSKPDEDTAGSQGLFKGMKDDEKVEKLEKQMDSMRLGANSLKEKISPS